jgi:hypothetical protein
VWRVDTSIIGFVKDKKKPHIFQFPEETPPAWTNIIMVVFRLGVRDSSVESPLHHASHLGLQLTYHENFILI